MGKILKSSFKNIMSASMKVRVIGIIVLLIVIGVVVSQVFFSGSKQQYTFDTVEKGTVEQLVTINGNVVASNETDVFSPTTGVLDQVYVKNADTVNSGDKLFSIRSTATPLEQAAALSAYKTAQSTLTTAQNNQSGLDATMWTKQQNYLTALNTQNIKNSNAINTTTGKTYTDLEKRVIDSAVIQAQKDFNAAEQAYKTASVAIADAQAQVNSTSLAYQATQNAVITAPISGTIHNIIGLTGAKVLAQTNSSTTPTTSLAKAQAQSATTVTPVLIIGNTNGYSLSASISEVYINKVGLGRPVTIRFSAIPNKSYKGRVMQMDTFGTNTQGVISYNVFISIDTIDQNIKPNMSAIMTIHTAEHKNVLTAANSAIIPYQNGKAVQVLDKNEKVVFKPVSVGLRGNTRSEIVSGISEGTDIIIGNTEFINQNSKSFSLGE